MAKKFSVHGWAVRSSQARGVKHRKGIQFAFNQDVRLYVARRFGVASILPLHWSHPAWALYETIQRRHLAIFRGLIGKGGDR
jgi:hypothetical protein